MIVYEETAPLLRFGEFEIAGRRVAVRAFPYSGEAGTPAFRYDPIERRFIRREPEGHVLCGPSDPQAWRDLFMRGPAGPALVGPCALVEEIRGAYRAASEGARETGRGVYLLDPEPSGLHSSPGEGFVALYGWHLGELAEEAISAAVGMGIPAGLLLPVIPGWTAEPEFLAEVLSFASRAGLRFVAPVAPSYDGKSRRRMVEARGDAEGFFELIHHLDWEKTLPGYLSAVREAARAHGFALLPPRPVGAAEPPGNAAAAARLEEKAEAASQDEYMSSLLHAAARWIDESGRDLRAVLSEGNFRKVFPFRRDIAEEAERALWERSP